jgi:DNA-binding MarR family transcriptional regulator
MDADQNGNRANPTIAAAVYPRNPRLTQLGTSNRRWLHNIFNLATMPIPSPKRRSRAFDSPRQEAYLNLWRTYDRLRNLEDDLFANHDLTAQQYNALRLLRGEHPDSLPTLAIAEWLVSRAPDITRLLDKLEQRGLVARQRLADNRRVVKVGITENGLRLLAELDGPVRECHERQLGHLTDEQLNNLIELLRMVRMPHEEPGTIWT